MKQHIEEGVHTFQSDLVQLAIASVFLLLTAFITWDLLIVTLFTPFFLAGLVVVGLLILVIRPLAVLVSTIRTRFTLRERIFMSFFGPRGIVIAATGTGKGSRESHQRAKRQTAHPRRALHASSLWWSSEYTSPRFRSQRPKHQCPAAPRTQNPLLLCFRPNGPVQLAAGMVRDRFAEAT